MSRRKRRRLIYVRSKAEFHRAYQAQDDLLRLVPELRPWQMSKTHTPTHWRWEVKR